MWGGGGRHWVHDRCGEVQNPGAMNTTLRYRLLLTGRGGGVLLTGGEGYSITHAHLN